MSFRASSKKVLRCFVTVEQIEKLNRRLLIVMYHQFDARLSRNILANHMWIYERCLTAPHRDAR